MCLRGLFHLSYRHHHVSFVCTMSRTPISDYLTSSWVLTKVWNSLECFQMIISKAALHWWFCLRECRTPLSFTISPPRCCTQSSFKWNKEFCGIYDVWPLFSLWIRTSAKCLLVMALEWDVHCTHIDVMVRCPITFDHLLDISLVAPLHCRNKLQTLNVFDFDPVWCWPISKCSQWDKVVCVMCDVSLFRYAVSSQPQIFLPNICIAMYLLSCCK